MILDRIDGGVSLLLRTPGYCVAPNARVEEITINTYISPHEIKFNGPHMQEKVALLIQQFGTDIGLPHLHCFTKRCEDEGIPKVKMPRSSLISTISLSKH